MRKNNLQRGENKQTPKGLNYWTGIFGAPESLVSSYFFLKKKRLIFGAPECLATFYPERK
jgi:hypothetical protein